MKSYKLFSLPTTALIAGALIAITAGCGKKETGDWVTVPLTKNTYYESAREYSVEDFNILVLNQSALEFKLDINAGDVITYAWSVEMENPELLTIEFHGHTEREGDEQGTVMFYKTHKGNQEQGALVAPFSGIHGWYLKNDSDEDIRIQLQVSGFFEKAE